MKKCFIAIIILLSIGIPACSQISPQLSPTDTVMVTLAPSVEPTKLLDRTNCFYVEASSEMIAAADQVQSALKSDKIDVINTSARGDGRNYVCPNVGTSIFTSSQTTLSITLKVDALDDLNALGQLTGKVLDNLISLPPQAVPHWQDGQIQINFTSGSDSRNLVFLAAFGVAQRAKGLDGATLWQALNNQPCSTQTIQDSDTDLSSQIQAALNKIGVSGISITVVVDSNQCVNPQDGTIESYSAQKTTFNFNLSVSDLKDQEANGNTAAQAVAALAGVAKTDIPGDQPAVVSFDFNDGSTQQLNSIDYNQIMNAYQSGSKGAKLYILITSQN